jgi:DNA-binding transcriptional ArsR family regulator
MRTFMNITKALAEEKRVRIILALRNGELCVCQIIELLGLAPSTVSKHMSVLRQAGIVEGRKDGRWMYYRLAGKEAPDEVRGAVSWVCESLVGNAAVREDSVRLAEILSLGREALCEKKNKGEDDD